eukprot:6212840-Pleurochrysis_carterae.AAC.4
MRSGKGGANLSKLTKQRSQSLRRPNELSRACFRSACARSSSLDRRSGESSFSRFAPARTQPPPFTAGALPSCLPVRLLGEVSSANGSKLDASTAQCVCSECSSLGLEKRRLHCTSQLAPAVGSVCG